MVDKEHGWSLERKYFLFILFFLLLISVVLFFLSVVIDSSFLLKYSSDGLFEEGTLKKISLMRSLLLFFSTVPLIVISLGFGYYESCISFISRNKDGIANLFLLIVVVTIFFAITELVFWSILKDETSFSSAGPASIKFNRDYVRVNNEGFRSGNFSIDKTENTLRIVVIGDSISFGSGIPNPDDAYPELVEKKLNEMDLTKKYEVYNFGIPGYDAEDELETLRDKVMKYSPDIILIEYYENDLENVDPELKTVENIDNWEIPVFGFWLRGTSYGYYFLESRFNRAVENFGIKRKWLDTLELTYGSEINKEYNWRIYDEIAEIAESESIPVVLVVFPVISDFEKYQFYMVHDFARSIAERNNFYFIDLFETYRNYAPSEISVNKYDNHPNEIGHMVAAENILENFINQGILD